MARFLVAVFAVVAAGVFVGENLAVAQQGMSSGSGTTVRPVKKSTTVAKAKKPSPEARRCTAAFNRCTDRCRNPFGKIAGTKAVNCSNACIVPFDRCLNRALGR